MNPLLTFIILVGVLASHISGASLDRAKQLAKEGRYLQARTTLDSLLQDNPDNSDAMLLKGLCFSWEKQFDSARTYLKQVLKLTPTYREAWQGIINTWKWQDNKDSLEAALIAACNTFPKDSLFCKPLTTSQLPSKNQKQKPLLTVPPPKTKNIWTATSLRYRGDLYQLSPERSPWGQITLEQIVKTIKWVSVTGIQAARRSYGPEVFGYGAGITQMLNYRLHPVFLLELLGGLSPYAMFDTVFAKFEAGLGASVSIKNGFILRGRANYRDYGNQSTIFFLLAADKYLSRFLFSISNYLTPGKDRLFYSCDASGRVFWGPNSAHWAGIKAGAGKSELSEGGLGQGEFIFLFGRAEVYYLLTRHFGMAVSGESAREQYGYNEPFMRWAWEAGLTYNW
ncbi:MAG: tetratricopeptide repeat protein [Fibrobacteria bacterium]|nr:tetratricopeptide repeat protein [Fibrobacteria bacterium]